MAIKCIHLKTQLTELEMMYWKNGKELTEDIVCVREKKSIALCFRTNTYLTLQPQFTTLVNLIPAMVHSDQLWLIERHSNIMKLLSANTVNPI